MSTILSLSSFRGQGCHLVCPQAVAQGTHEIKEVASHPPGNAVESNDHLSPTPPQKKKKARHQWLTPVIPATQEAEIRRLEVKPA
jgi:hypothetical protein